MESKLNLNSPKNKGTDPQKESRLNRSNALIMGTTAHQKQTISAANRGLGALAQPKANTRIYRKI